MARPKGTPSYLHHKSSGKAFVRIEGKNIYLGFFGTKESKAEYDRVISEWLANGRQLPQLENHARSVTIDGLCEAYLDFAEGYYRKNGELTDEIYKVVASIRLLHEHCGMLPASDFTRQSLLAIQQKASTTGWKRRTVNERIQTIKRIFKWAANRGFITAAVYQELTLLEGLKKDRCPCPESIPVPPVSMDVVHKTLEHCPPIIADMAMLQYLAGMRPGEVCDLRACDIDISGDVWEFDYKSHKTRHHGHTRPIWFGERAQRILTPYLMDAEEHPDRYLFSPKETVQWMAMEKRRKRKSKVQPSQVKRSQDRKMRTGKNPPGEKYREDSYRNALQRAAKKAGVERWFPNQLRHTRATEIRAQFDLEAAQIVLGHEKADVTQIYAERDRKKGMEIMRKIG